MGGQNGKPKIQSALTVDPDTDCSEADISSVAPHQTSLQKPNSDCCAGSNDGITKSCSEITHGTNGEDLDSLIEFLESDPVDSDMKGSGQSFAIKSDLDDLVEMLERDVVNPSSESKKGPFTTPADREYHMALPLTQYQEFNITPMATARDQIANNDGVLHGDSELEEWAALVEEKNQETRI